MKKRNPMNQTCREYRVIPFADLPTYTDDSGTREATDAELMQMGIYVFNRGSSQAQCLCVGFWHDDLECGVDASGKLWPGTKLEGAVGVYRDQRTEAIAQSMATYKDGNNSGKVRLMETPLAVESARDVIDEDGKVIETLPAQKLTEVERLARRLPKIMGDG